MSIFFFKKNNKRSIKIKGFWINNICGVYSYLATTYTKLKNYGKYNPN